MKLDPQARGNTLVKRVRALFHFRHIVGRVQQALRRFSSRQHDLKIFRFMVQKIKQPRLFNEAVVAGGDRFVKHEQRNAVRTFLQRLFQKRRIDPPRRRPCLFVHRAEKAKIPLAAEDCNVRQRTQDVQFRGTAVLQKLRKQHALSRARCPDAQPNRRRRLALSVAAVQVHKSPHTHTSRSKMR